MGTRFTLFFENYNYSTPLNLWTYEDKRRTSDSHKKNMTLHPCRFLTVSILFQCIIKLYWLNCVRGATLRLYGMGLNLWRFLYDV